MSSSIHVIIHVIIVLIDQKPVAELRRELIEDGLNALHVNSLKKTALIRATISEFCSRYRDCKAFECARCTAKGVNYGTCTSSTCETCEFTTTTYQNGFQTEHLDSEYDPFKDGEHPENMQAYAEAVERLQQCPVHSHLSDRY